MRSWLKELRQRNLETQSETAKKLDISESYYNMIENGERQKRLSMELARKIADVFGVSLDYISEQEESEVR